MSAKKFTGNFTQQEPIPEAAIAAAVEVMRHGRLHRYNTIAGEASETVLLEQEFAQAVGARFCLAVASGGYALAAALRAIIVGPGDKVLTNSFTLAPVPGAIANVGAEPVFVEVTENLVLDLDDLVVKIDQSGARTLMLSHMRGHQVDMEALCEICSEKGVAIVEDCAHTMGAAWKGRPSGRWGVVGCYSTQTYKHLNSGEGGFLVTDDAEIMARATMLSGSYMLYESHQAGAPASVFDNIRLDTPNCSGRMDNLRAAILRPQLAALDTQVARWNRRYRALEAVLAKCGPIQLTTRPQQETIVGSSFQFLCPGFSKDQMIALRDRCLARGVELKWFGADTPSGFTSRHDSWRYVQAQSLPQTDAILAVLMDIRVPLTFSQEDCTLIAEIISEEAISLAT